MGVKLNIVQPSLQVSPLIAEPLNLQVFLSPL